MSRERADVLVFEKDIWEQELASFAQQAELAARRQRKAAPGDLKEALRYDQLCAQMEERARTLPPRDQLNVDGDVLARLDACGLHHAWCAARDLASHPLSMVPAVAHALDRGGVALELRDPWAVGHTASAASRGEPVAPADPWRPDGADEDAAPPPLPARQAQRKLWEAQLRAVQDGEDAALVPTGITNSVLTEGLRAAAQSHGRPPALGRVIYRDGSEARPFPLGALSLADETDHSLPLLRFALMSLRHPEMDIEVDGAWLRNRLVSQVRPQAQTDKLVFELSRERLEALTSSGAVRVRLYQTGLQAAVMGVYRAVCEHLLAQPHSVCVEPYYWRGRAGWEVGTPWRTR